MYFRLAPDGAARLGDATELTLFAGGYAGMQPVEAGRTALCIAVGGRAFRSYGGGWTELVAAIGGTSRRFAAMLAGAAPLLPRPLAIAGIPYGYRTRAMPPAGLFRLGDQAAVIPSLTGDGMAIAVHSGQAAAGSWLAGADNACYHRGLLVTLAHQMRLAGWFHAACMNGQVQSALAGVTALFPVILRQAARGTRLPKRDPHRVRAA
jgi:flavin-dependent dehydrogenase